MKKRHQIDRERAVQKFQKQAQHSEETLQLALPLKQVAAALEDGVGHLMRQAGLELMQLIMEEEVRQLAGERYQRREQGQHYRWGGEKGFSSSTGRKGRSSARGCAATRAANSRWAATSCFVAQNRWTRLCGTSLCSVYRRAITAKRCANSPTLTASKSPP